MPESSMSEVQVFKAVMTDGTVHQCEPFIPREDRTFKMDLGGEDVEGIWVSTDDRGWELYQQDEQTGCGGVIMVTLRNHAVCWWGLPSWGMVLPAVLRGRGRRPRCDLRLLDIPATMAANGDNMPFLMVESVRAPAP